MHLFRRFRDAVIGAALIIIPFLLLNSNLKDPERTNALDRALLQISAPIQYVAVASARTVSSVFQEYFWLVDAKKELARLQHENARLRAEKQQMQKQIDENTRLRAMLNLKRFMGGETISAQVVAKPISSFFRVTRLVLDKGERNLVKPGMPVISAEGLVGQVRRVAGRYSDVLLVVDRRSAVDVVLERNGARGMLRGTGNEEKYLCRLQYLSQADEVRVGDKVLTSGLGKRFPKAIAVGKVSKIMRREFGLHQEVEVMPVVDFGDLEEVLVVVAPSKEVAGDMEVEEAK